MHWNESSTRSPIQRGMVVDWDAMETLWEYIYAKQLFVDSTDHPLLITEQVLNTEKDAIRKCEILFEKLNCPQVFLGVPAVLSMYTSGMMTGVAVDVGDGVTSVLPMYEGFVQSEAIAKRDLAGSDVTEHLKKLLRGRTYILNEPFDSETVKDLKEKTAQIQIYSLGASARPFPVLTHTSYKLPDGRAVSIGEERLKCGEVLFNPTRCGQTGEGIHTLVIDSILQCHREIRPALWKNIVLSGGTTKLVGFPERFKAEVAQLAQVEKLKVKDVKESFSAWAGGAMLSELSTFNEMCISQTDFAENKRLSINKNFFNYLGTN